MNLALWPPALQHLLPALLFVCVLLVLFLLFVVVLFGESKQKQGRVLVVRKLVQAPTPTPSSVIAGVPKRLFCLGSFGDFRCGVSLFIVILVI